EAGDRIGEGRVRVGREHSRVVHSVCRRRETPWIAGRILCQVPQEIRLEDHAHRVVGRLLVDQAESGLQVTEVRGHVYGVLHVLEIESVAFTGVGNVIEHEEGNHAERAAVPDVSGGAVARRRGPGIPAVYRPAIQVNVSDVHAAVFQVA